jgi:hypothetical protein
MASEIRVNQIQSRTGVSTVSFTDSGPIFAGISTVEGTLIVDGGITGDITSSGTSTLSNLNVTGNVGIGTDAPGSLVHALGSYGTLRVENDNTAQYAASGIELKGPAGDERSTKIVHGNNNTGGTETYFQIEQLNAAGSYVKTLSTYSYQYDYWAFNTGGTEKLRITSDGKIGIGSDTPTEKLEIRDGGLLINGSNLAGILTEDVLDDTFVSIDLTQPGFILGGLLLITTSGGGVDPSLFPQPIGTGLVYYDCGSSLGGARILADADTGANPLTGGTVSTSTTITDFTDGRVTIICNTNTLRIANRTGGTRRFKLTFV